MKKVNFSNIKGILSRDEMRVVKGGGSCGFRVGGTVSCGMPKEIAQLNAAAYGGYWCCDSCGGNGGSASYC